MEQTITLGKFERVWEKKNGEVTYYLCELQIMKKSFYAVYVQGKDLGRMEIVGDNMKIARLAWNAMCEGCLSPIHLYDWICDFRRETIF